MTGPLPQDGIERLVALFARDGYARVEPPLLQPADIFIDLSGEDIRRRLFATQDADGAALCLRPEYTIPVCRLHLQRGRREPAAYGYLGPVFRLRPGETGEVLQAGIESIGREDVAATDAEVLAFALEGLAALGRGGVVRLGDMGLLDAVIAALDVPPAARLRLIRSIAAGRLSGAPPGPEPAGADHLGLLAAIEGQNPQAVRALVEDVLSIAGIASVGGRSAAEIAERFTARAANRSGGLAAEARAVLDRYLAIEGDPDAALTALRRLADEAGLDLGAALDRFEERTGFMAAAGLDIAALRFRADFARPLDYYTGFIFEVLEGEGAEARPLVGGGRYDRLLGHLGAPEPVPAIGCAFWLDRLQGGGR